MIQTKILSKKHERVRFLKSWTKTYCKSVKDAEFSEKIILSLDPKRLNAADGYRCLEISLRSELRDEILSDTKKNPFDITPQILFLAANMFPKTLSNTKMIFLEREKGHMIGISFLYKPWSRALTKMVECPSCDQLVPLGTKKCTKCDKPLALPVLRWASDWE